ncbi:MAG: ABC transporter ATP-binding protein [Sporomusaceae bacterium]|nr:ABC transporter ATP-binding protein [Sporomusaceae bacterium]
MYSFYWQKFILPFWPQLAVALASFLVASIAGLAAPIIIKLLIDDVLIEGDLVQLHIITAAIIVLYLLRGAFSYIYGYLMAKAGNRLIADMRQELFGKLQSKDYAYFVNNQAGEVISLFSNDLVLIQQAVAVSIPEFCVEILNVLAILGIMIYFDWQLSLVTFATLPFIFLVVGYFNRRTARIGLLMEDSLAKVSGFLHQVLLSTTIVKSYGREDYEYRKFSEKINQAADEFLSMQRLNAVLVPLVEFLAAIGLTVIIWFGGREVIEGELTIGGMFAFLVYIINIPTPLRKVAEAATGLRMGSVAWERIQGFQAQPRTIFDGGMEPKQAGGLVEFRDVSFRYTQNAGILHHINLTAGPDEIIAIVGPSGAGKSSVANLLLRLYDPSSGGIYIDQVDIRALNLAAHRKRIGFIQQEPILFHGSIRDNIRYGRPKASDACVEWAARMADAHDFILALPRGYETEVGECGSLLSGGQRQRIAIARALILEPAILVLDEPTAALDSQSERQVMASIRRAGRGRTTFLITHRLSILAASDRIVYLADGHIVETGTHYELLQCGGLYAKAVALEALGA